MEFRRSISYDESQPTSSQNKSFADILKKKPPNVFADFHNLPINNQWPSQSSIRPQNDKTRTILESKPLEKSFAKALKITEDKRGSSRSTQNLAVGGIRPSQNERKPIRNVDGLIRSRQGSSDKKNEMTPGMSWRVVDSSTFRKEPPRGPIATNSGSNRNLESSKLRNKLPESSRTGSNRLLEISRPKVGDDDWSKVEKVGRKKRLKAPEVLIHPNRISAETFHRIGSSTEGEKYVMAQDDRRSRKNKKKLTEPRQPHLEIEFVAEVKSKYRDDIEIEFVDPGREIDQFTNKISALTYRQIGNSENEKYVMSAGQNNLSRIVEHKTVEQPTLRDIHDMIKDKLKSGEELTPTEREVIRQKRRDRRRREKEEKRRQRDEEKRHKILNQPRSQHIKLISADLLQKVKGFNSPVSGGSADKPVVEKGIKFQDEEYPDLNQKVKKKEVVLSRVARDQRGSLLSDQETGSEWETEYSDVEHSSSTDNRHNNIFISDEEGLETNSAVSINNGPSNVTVPGEPLSYSSILKSAPKPKAILQTKSAVNKEGIKTTPTTKKNPTINNESTSEKKKVKSKDPIKLDLIACIQEKKKISKKQAPVISGKIANERYKKVGNTASSGPAVKKRGKEKEGGKKKRLTPMRKIIKAEKSKRKLERELAAQRREDRKAAGIRMKPLTEHPGQQLTEQPGTQLTEHPVQQLTGPIEADSTKSANSPSFTENIETLTLTHSSNHYKQIEDKSEDKHENKEDMEEDKEENKADGAKDETKKENVEESQEEKAKKNIHTAKFRDYCDQELSSDLDQWVIKLMSDIIRFQDKAFAKNPVLAKTRKRYAVGLRETIKFLKVKKVACVLMAPDLERISSEGGLDNTVDNIKEACKEQDIPVVYTLSRYKLGRACVRKMPVSSVAILNKGFHGSEENYKMMIDLCTQLKQSYAARLNIEIQNLQPKKLVYVPGMDFVPGRPSSLKYSPGVEFIPEPQSIISTNDKKDNKRGGRRGQGSAGGRSQGRGGGRGTGRGRGGAFRGLGGHDFRGGRQLSNQYPHNQNIRQAWNDWQRYGDYQYTQPQYYNQQYEYPNHSYGYYGSNNIWKSVLEQYQNPSTYSQGYGLNDDVAVPMVSQTNNSSHPNYNPDTSNISEFVPTSVEFKPSYSGQLNTFGRTVEPESSRFLPATGANPRPESSSFLPASGVPPASDNPNSQGLHDWSKILQILRE